jgi:hypothetical protein
MSRTGPGFGRGHRPVTIALATFELVWPSLPHRSPIPRTSSPPPSSAGPRRVPSAPPSCVPRQRPHGGSPSSSAASPFALRERPSGSSGIDMPDCRRRARNQALLGPLGWRVSHPPAASEPGAWARACTCRTRCSASRGERAAPGSAAAEQGPDLRLFPRFLHPPPPRGSVGLPIHAVRAGEAASTGSEPTARAGAATALRPQGSRHRRVVAIGGVDGDLA